MLILIPLLVCVICYVEVSYMFRNMKKIATLLGWDAYELL